MPDSSNVSPEAEDALLASAFRKLLHGESFPMADGSHRAGEDSDLIKRMNAAGYRISHLPERTWRWHHHYGNTSGLPERRRVQ